MSKRALEEPSTSFKRKKRQQNEPNDESVSSPVITWELTNCAFKKEAGHYISEYTLNTSNVSYEINSFLNGFRPKLLCILEKAIAEHNTIKINLCLSITCTVTHKSVEKDLSTRLKIVNKSTNVSETFESLFDELRIEHERISEYENNCIHETFNTLKMNVAKYDPLRGGAYFDLPKSIKDKKAVLNIQNDDNQCFKWCILAYLHPVASKSQPHRVAHYQCYNDELNFDGIEFPMHLEDIRRFEKQNTDREISIRVYTLNEDETKVIGPDYSSERRLKNHISLLLVERKDEDRVKSHYCLIRSMPRLIGKQISGHKSRKYICDWCLIHFSTPKKFNEHQQQTKCNTVNVEFPLDDIKNDKFGMVTRRNVLRFNNIENKQDVPFVVYADLQDHSYGFYFKCRFDDKLSEYFAAFCEQPAPMLLKRLEVVFKKIALPFFKKNKKRIVTASARGDFERSTVCYLCERAFANVSDKLWDHCHLSGTYRGAAHKTCNINYKLPKYIPVIFHDLTTERYHKLIKGCNVKLNKDIAIRSPRKEYYIGISKRLTLHAEVVTIEMRILDSYKFLSANLDCFLTDQSSFIRNFEEFNNTAITQPFLPTIEFESAEKKTSLSEGDFNCAGDYRKAMELWTELNCENVETYLNHCTKLNVLRLTGVFEQFRNDFILNYDLDPAHYYTLQNYSWDAMLNMTKSEIILMTDPEMMRFVKDSLRGDICQLNKRHAIANNEKCQHFDQSKPASTIQVENIDLIGKALVGMLPDGNCQWLDEKEINELQITEIPDTSPVGYIFEVDLEYPTNLHDEHKDLPFCPASERQRIIASVENKENYVIHYRNLKQAMQHGLTVQKIHRVLKFSQSDWLRKFVEFNAMQAQSATNECVKRIFKKMNLAMFFKLQEDIEEYTEVKFARKWNNFKKLMGANDFIKNHNCKWFTIIDEDFILVNRKRTKVKYEYPITVGFTLLELTKYHLYDYFYNVIKKQYENNANLLYVAMNCLIFELFSNKFDEQFIGKGDTVWKFEGSCSKAYSLQYENSEENSDESRQRIRIDNSKCPDEKRFWKSDNESVPWGHRDASSR